SLGGIQVVVESTIEFSNSLGGSGGNFGTVSLPQFCGPQTKDQFLDPIEPTLRLRQTLKWEVHLLTIWNRNETISDCKRIVAALQKVSECKKVAFRFRHLLPINEEMFVMHPETHERFARYCFTLSDLVFVMGKNVIDAAAVDVQRLTQLLHRHCRTFEMPARPTGTERSFPSGFLFILRRFPQNEVARRLFLVLVDINSCSRFQFSLV